MMKTIVNIQKKQKNILLLIAVLACLGIIGLDAARMAHPIPAIAAGESKSARDSRRDAAQSAESKAEDVVPSDIKTQENYLSDTVPVGRPINTGGIGRLLFSLIFVIGLIIVLGYFFRNLWAKGVRLDVRGRNLRVLDTLQLGYNRSIFLVQVGTRAVLLGSTDKGVEFLTEITDQAELTALTGDASPEGELAENKTFTRHLADAFLRQSPGGARAVPFAEKFKERLNRLNPESANEPGGGPDKNGT